MTASKNRRPLKRMWINQPSTHQPLHRLNGAKVLYDEENQEIYFTEGPVISQQVPHPSVLSPGWPK